MADSDSFVDGVCGQTVLRLCSRGSAIIAEMSRLAEHVPAAFLGPDLCPAAAMAEARRYGPVLFDLSYLVEPQLYDGRVSGNIELSDIDDECQETHESIVARFYTLFESIWKYHDDLGSFLQQLQDGFYIHSTVDSVLLDPEGRQLLIEALSLKGVMLLLLDRRVPGPARERLIVSHLRYAGEGAARSIEEVSRLCKDSGFLPQHLRQRAAARAAARTGTQPGSRQHTRALDAAMASSARPKAYPLALFARAPVPEAVLAQVLGTLRSYDIYSKAKVYPRPDQRSAALAQQAAHVYVVLHFAPAVLMREKAMMRELTDKHFSDNWVVPVYMGFSVDLSLEWAEFPAAIAALSTDTLQVGRVKELAARFASLRAAADKRLTELLAEGALTEATVVESVPRVLDVLRAANVSLRWLLLHRATIDGTFRQAVRSVSPDADELLTFLLRTAEFEFRLKGLLNSVIEARAANWQAAQEAVGEQLSQVSALFSGAIPSAIDPDDELAQWFARLAGEVGALDPARATVSGRKIHKLSEALREVESFEAVDAEPLVRDFLRSTRERLTGMVRLLNVDDAVVHHADMISDLSYAWGPVMESNLPRLHARIHASPDAVGSMRALFHKLGSILDLPVNRVAQAGSKDLSSVAQHYSKQLVRFVRNVMEAVPVVVFQLLSRVADLRAQKLAATPVRFEVGELKSLARLPARHELALRTHQISTFTEGVARQERTLLGVIEVDPKAILHDGIRKQLVVRVSEALDRTLVFDLASLPAFAKASSSSSSSSSSSRGMADPRDAVRGALHRARHTLASLHASVEYIQDFIGVKGLRMWQEELARLFAFNAEQAANQFVRKRVAPDASRYQSDAAPIPLLVDAQGRTFLTRVLEALEALSNPAVAVFSPAGDGWFTPDGRETLGLGIVADLRHCLGVPGLLGLDRLLGFAVVRRLDRTLRRFQAEARAGAGPVLSAFRADVMPATSLLHRGTAVHDAVAKKLTMQLRACASDLVSVGHAQLLRRRVAHQLRQASSLESGPLASAASSLNAAVLSDTRSHYHRPAQHAFPTPDNPLLPRLASLLEQCGASDPSLKVYVTRDALPLLDVWLALTLIHTAPLLQYDADFRCLVQADRRKGAWLDGPALVHGLATVLKQLHPAVLRACFAFVGQYVRTSVHASLTAKKPEPTPPAAIALVLLLQETCDALSLPRALLHCFVPEHVIACLTG